MTYFNYFINSIYRNQMFNFIEVDIVNCHFLNHFEKLKIQN